MIGLEQWTLLLPVSYLSLLSSGAGFLSVLIPAPYEWGISWHTTKKVYCRICFSNGILAGTMKENTWNGLGLLGLLWLCYHHETTRGSFLKISFNVESETVSVIFSVSLQPIGLIWILDLLIMYDFIISRINHRTYWFTELCRFLNYWTFY